MKSTNKFIMAIIIVATGITACNDNDILDPQPDPTDPNGVATTGRVYINECDPNAKQWELYNAENYAVTLSGWTMYKDNERDADNTFVFPDITIEADGYLVLTRNAEGSPTFGMSTTKGFKYELYNAQTQQVDVFDNLGENIINSNVAEGYTLGRLTDGANDIVTFSTGTIGASNSGGMVWTPPVVDPEMATTGRVYINECDPNAKQWELYNTENYAINLSGWTMYKDNGRDAASTFVFPNGATIEVGEYLVLTRNAAGSPTFGMSSDKGFKYELYNAEAEEVDVFDNLGDNIINSNVAEGYTLGRLTDGANDIVTFSAGTIGASNNGSNVWTPPVVTEDYSALVINEVDGNGKFIELYNKGTVTIRLAGLTLRKNGNDVWWTGTAESEILAGGYHTIYQSGTTIPNVADVEATGASGISPKKTLSFDLKTPDGNTVIDRFARLKEGSTTLDANCTPDYGTVGGYSFSRCPDGIGGFALATPTPAATNGTSQGAIVTE